MASGDLPLRTGAALIPLLLLGALLAALPLPREFLAVLGIYLALTLSYSLKLKGVVLIDVVLLAGLYTLRIIAGAAAIHVPYSPWLLGFAVFFFLSLALVKRYSELIYLQEKGESSSDGRGYRATDLHQLCSLGGAAGYISVLVLALYIYSEEVLVLYSRPLWLWAICPLMIYWISRVWLLAHRGEMHDDPVIFALKDHVSYTVGTLVVLIVLAAA